MFYNPLTSLIHILTEQGIFQKVFADDTNIFQEDTEYHKVISTFITELIKVSDWLNTNKLTIYLNKTIHGVSSIHN